MTALLFCAALLLGTAACGAASAEEESDTDEASEYASETPQTGEAEDAFLEVSTLSMDWGADTQTVTAQTADGVTLSAKLDYAAAESHSWVIAIHGMYSCADDIESYLDAYRNAGWNVLAVDLRGWGDSEGTCSMGYWEHDDIVNWANAIAEADPEAQIVLHGFSMGAVTAMLAGSDARLTDQVRAIIEDSGYSDLEQVLQTSSNWATLDEIQSQYPVLLEEENSALYAVANTDIPILFLHGDQDTTVPVEMAYALYDAAAGEKSINIFEGCGHVGAVESEEAYWDIVLSFLYACMSD